MTLIVRDARDWRGERVDIAMADGAIVAVGASLELRGEEFDAAGATVLPGLHDHHLHVLATAARRESIDLARCGDAASVHAAIARAAQDRPPGAWLRAVGYDERAAGLPDRAVLDGWAPAHRLRLQDRTGALWVLNGLALASLAPNAGFPAGAERDAAGLSNGRFWREDRWLGAHLSRTLPDLPALGRELAVLGLTGLTDAGARNGPEEAAVLAGALPQKLMLMGDETLAPGAGYALGPLKLLIDERDPPLPDALAERICTGRVQSRAVAAHCVTAAELALYLAALDIAGGARAGDRIEHGGMIAPEAIAAIGAMGLTVVTNPGFIHDRGERYRATIPEAEWPDLYRARSLRDAGIRLAAGSDGPYASVDPWMAMRAARDRLTAAGKPIGRAERFSAEAALRLYLGAPDRPGGTPRRIAPGEPADLILCSGSRDAILGDLSAERVRATVIAGRPS